MASIIQDDVKPKTPVNNLPHEILQAIFNRLSLPSLKSARLVTKLWAAIGEPYLISPTFRTYPHRPDTLRLASIAHNPIVSHRIEAIVFNHGELNEYHARHNTYFLQFMIKPEERLASQVTAFESYAQLKALKQVHFPPSYDVDVLAAAFGKLRNLEKVEISLMNCPFDIRDHEDLDLLRDIWKIPSTRLMPRDATKERFTDIMTALSSNTSTLKLKSLAHDRLPFEFFSLNLPINIPKFIPIFTTLTTLNLGLECTELLEVSEPGAMRRNKGFGTLATYLRAATKLEELTLTFYDRKKLDITHLLVLLSTHAFEKLNILTLTHITTTERDLGNFLVRQQALKSVQLGNEGFKPPHQPPKGGVYLQRGSFKALWERLEREMQDVRVLVQGDLLGEESGERWILDEIVGVETLREYVID